MFKKSKPILLFSIATLCFSTSSYGQGQAPDSSINEIAPVEVKAYFHKQMMLQLSHSTQVISQQSISSQNPSSLVSALNSSAGLRIEERSPGSYRLALRGSMLRSPFGVRNSKIYMDEIPLTDASGNTYLNLLDPIGIEQVLVMKGPDGSLFGPNSGGVLQLTPNGLGERHSRKSFHVGGGSFGLFQQQLSFSQEVNDRYQFAFDQAYLRSDGYREQTGMQKKYFQTSHQWNYANNKQFKLFAIYSDLGYETPGGLNAQQMEENPRQARPATATLPGAIQQQAAIYNKTLLGGITHEINFKDHWKHVIALFGSTTDFKNPFITNYEVRDEKNIGYRTYLSYQQEDNPNWTYEMQLGTEAQQGHYHILNHENNLGIKGTLTDDDQLENFQHFYFYRIKTQIANRFLAEGSIGLSYYDMEFNRNIPNQAAVSGQKKLDPNWMPRLGLSYLFNPLFAIRGSISKGYSTPTIAEVRSSDNQINENLQPEEGTNYELGLRFESVNRTIIADISAYSYQMKDGIIRQVNEQGNEYFVNAGEIDQQGIEASLFTHLLDREQANFFKNMVFSSHLTYQDYTFKSYQLTDQNYSGNRVTSVPQWIWVNNLNLQLNKQFNLTMMHNFTSRIPLNDANSVYSNKYHLLQAKVSWIVGLNEQLKLQVFLGGDNLLNEKYSLGNDINALGNRYFNPSPTRNYYAGIKIMY
ncbi:TonB-dependent receptor [Sphingobacterium sp. HJSM2_6]|uniref:TonB-dependent receptor n=1 Tax=Sphingobacterium sp. HJSM2_6 TaxID=3366264 RepID=UPI003BDB6DDE